MPQFHTISFFNPLRVIQIYLLQTIINFYIFFKYDNSTYLSNSLDKHTGLNLDVAVSENSISSSYKNEIDQLYSASPLYNVFLHHGAEYT